MKQFILYLILLFEFSSCMKSQNINIPIGSKENPSANEAVATFGEGCFWHSEIIFQSLFGVRDAVSGYAGGKDSNPNYEKVSSGLRAMLKWYRYFMILQKFHLKL